LDKQVGAVGGFLASPVGGGIASWLFSTEECPSWAAGACYLELNVAAGAVVTAIGWGITAIYYLGGGE
jgi:hypothetical protein